MIKVPVATVLSCVILKVIRRILCNFMRNLNQCIMERDAIRILYWIMNYWAFRGNKNWTGRDSSHSTLDLPDDINLTMNIIWNILKVSLWMLFNQLRFWVVRWRKDCATVWKYSWVSKMEFLPTMETFLVRVALR